MYSFEKGDCFGCDGCAGDCDGTGAEEGDENLKGWGRIIIICARMETEPNYEYRSMPSAIDCEGNRTLRDMQQASNRDKHEKAIQGNKVSTYPKDTGHEPADRLGGDFLGGFDISFLVGGGRHDAILEV